MGIFGVVGVVGVFRVLLVVAEVYWFCLVQLVV